MDKTRKPKKPPVSHKPSYVAQVLYECGGVTRDAASRLSMDANTVRSYIRKYPSVREARESAMDDLKDMATSNLVNLIKEKDKAATFFVLSRFRQKDGTWTQKQDESESEAKEEPLEIECDDE